MRTFYYLMLSVLLAACRPTPAAAPTPSFSLPNTTHPVAAAATPLPQPTATPFPAHPFPPPLTADDLPILNHNQMLNTKQDAAATPNLVIPTADPDIIALMNEVSSENLQTTVQTLVGFGTRHVLSTTESEQVGIGAARRWLVQEFERVGRGRIRILIDEFSLDPACSAGSSRVQQNIIAALPGRDSTMGALVVMAHYDSRGEDAFDGNAAAPGANDNASGVALLLELARLMSGRTWNRTILFIAFAAEELETQGSHAFVAEWLSQGGQIDFALNNDVVGGHAGIASAVRVFSAGPDSSASRQLARYLHLVDRLYLPSFQAILEEVADRPQRYGDQREFAAAGIPAVRLTEVDEAMSLWHTGADTADRLNYGYLAEVTRLNLAVLGTLAMAPPPPAAPTLLTAAATGQLVIAWEVGGDAAAGYILAIRQPGSLAYDMLFYITPTQSSHITLTTTPLTTDCILGLAAIDTSGHPGSFSAETVLEAENK